MITLGSSAFADGGYGRVGQVQLKENPSYRKGVEAWVKLKESQKKACSPVVDSFELLHESKTETVVVLLHGYGLNPGKMTFLAEFFCKAGLQRHSSANSVDILMKIFAISNKVSRNEWLGLARKTLKAAHALGKRTIVVGYSLGGLLRRDLPSKNRKKSTHLFCSRQRGE